MDVIERMTVVIGANVSNDVTKYLLFYFDALLSSVSQGVLMKADVEGEIRVKCFMPSCSGELQVWSGDCSEQLVSLTFSPLSTRNENRPE